MKTLQEYKNLYSEIAADLGVKGDSVEVLVGLLANASYISEVENAVYMKEASLTKATLMNSKIQKCMDQMYSVFRGSCPRVILHVKFTEEKYIGKYDPIVSSNNFKIYFEAAWVEPEEEETLPTPILSNFTANEISAHPDDDYYILGILAPEVVSMEFNLSQDDFYKQTDANATNLSSDMYLLKDNVECDVTRIFGEHIKDKKVFDLTTTSFGSRLYFNNKDSRSVLYTARYFVYSTLSDYNPAEIRKIKMQGTTLIPFDPESKWVEVRGDISIEDGRMVLLEATGRDGLDKIHYLASKQRYTNQIIRSNSDVEALAKESSATKEKVKEATYRFISTPNNSVLRIYYVVTDQGELTVEEKNQFIAENKAYFVTDDIHIDPGQEYVAKFGITLVVYKDQSTAGIEEEVTEIMKEYNNKFGIDFDVLEEEIKSSISKISAVRSIKDYGIQYTYSGSPSPKPSLNATIPPYFDIQVSINIVQS